MDDCMAGLCTEICGELVLNVLATTFLFIADKLFVQRRQSVIWIGRRTQRILHIPECLCVFTEEDPGMLDSDIRMSGTVLILTYFMAGMAMLSTTVMRPDARVAWLCFSGIILPLSSLMIIWLGLILSKRRRFSHGGPKEDPEGMDTTVDEDCNRLWYTSY
ncbi:hypothetical protein F4805DRAFT_454454 [Annulohypoxylon moriforme]|nr:hypothetical protein F4805DRAFT_454454 [Annulohypoxylon moriforme]